MGTEFNSAQFEAIYPEGIENHYWTFARNKILAHVLSSSPKAGAILEIGCGKGVVVEYLHQRGFNIHGVELADVPVIKNVANRVRTGTDVFTVTDDKYIQADTVLLLDVIEHIESPREFMAGIRKAFPKAKTFIVTVPACSELFSNYDTFNGHYRRYETESLRNEFREVKHREIETSYFFHSLYFPTRMLLKTRGERADKIDAPKGFLNRSIHGMFALFFYLEYRIFPSRAKGTSLLTKVTFD